MEALDKSLRKQRVIDTATKVFHEKGPARQPGLTNSALYHYVSSKEELLFIIYIDPLEQGYLGGGNGTAGKGGHENMPAWKRELLGQIKMQSESLARWSRNWRNLCDG